MKRTAIEIVNARIFAEISLHTESMYNYMKSFKDTGDQCFKDNADRECTKVRVLRSLYRSYLIRVMDDYGASDFNCITDAFSVAINNQINNMEEKYVAEDQDAYYTHFYLYRMLVGMQNDIFETFAYETIK